MSDRTLFLISGAAMIVALLCLAFGTYEAMQVLEFDWSTANA